ncbi:Helix-turn-helix domain-containing protein [Halomicrobium zhouii]|uniref:Helix-turn-helix domain-containing protein n=1 Tax=Halomicrobium zhouii TaxID=767519 RepID=A0A1I6L1R8_9EURY|nr:helix-turn-helix domain-containing protein [Halomicrobium zhouii]SFR97391.1 Helix-turn-helix domain-containing protein [Halomicrobium zhouii]
MRIPTGEELRDARTERGLTQAELAERADVSQPLIARVESEDVDSRLGTLHSIVSALNGSETAFEQEEVELVMPSALKDARKQAGFTQGELAEVAGVSQPLISRIEREDVNPRASTLRSLFDHLDPVSETIDDGPTDSPGWESDNEILAEIESQFDALYDDDRSPDSGSTDSVNELSECHSCEVDLSGYPNPTFCPHCGSELDS